MSREDVLDAVLAHASENSMLLVKLGQTHEAPSILRAHLTHLQHLKDENEEQDKSLAELTETTETQFKVHSKLRDSNIRRFFYRTTRMLGKFEAKQMKVEREYFSALSKQSKAEERQRSLKRDLDEAETTQGSLEAAAKEHDGIHAQIDELYESLFAGPTPGFPYEDSRESGFNNARRKNDQTKANIIAARRAIRHMNQATANLNRAENYMRYAESDANNSIFFFDEALALLRHSNNYISNATSSVSRAEEQLRPLPREMNDVRAAIMTNLKAAQLETNARYDHDSIASAITNAQEKVSAAKQRLEELGEQVKAREAVGLVKIRDTARSMEDTRQALQEIRQGIFEEVAGFGEAAPAYMECCDRAEGFCELPPPPPPFEEPVDEGDDPVLQAAVRRQNQSQSHDHNHDHQPQPQTAGVAPAPPTADMPAVAATITPEQVSNMPRDMPPDVDPVGIPIDPPRTKPPTYDTAIGSPLSNDTSTNNTPARYRRTSALQQTTASPVALPPDISRTLAPANSSPPPPPADLRASLASREAAIAPSSAENADAESDNSDEDLEKIIPSPIPIGDEKLPR